MSMQRRELEAIKSLFGYLGVGDTHEAYCQVLDDGLRHAAIFISREPFGLIQRTSSSASSCRRCSDGRDRQVFKVVVDFDLVNELLKEKEKE